jgi:uncharacterized protein YndB with AHSA1/START domain
MSRVDAASVVVRADAARVFAALVDPDALARWLPPTGMTGSFEHFDARPGGSFRMVLRYADAGQGKTTTDSDVVEVRFVDIAGPERMVQAVDFVSDNPAFRGTMTMTWELRATADGTEVVIWAEDVPAGISAEDHAVGLESSLANLAAFIEGR